MGSAHPASREKREGCLTPSKVLPGMASRGMHVKQWSLHTTPQDLGREEIHLVWFIIHRLSSLRIKGPEPWAASWTTTAFAVHLSSDPPFTTLCLILSSQRFFSVT